MTQFKVEIINSALEVYKYLITAKDSKWAELSARARYGEYESAPITKVTTTQVQ